MNCKAAKSINIVAFLQSIGIEPQKIRNSRYWYLSPLREERTASFEVDINKNFWYDFGQGIGGDIIKLIMLIYNTDVAGALKILQDSSNTPCFNTNNNFHFSSANNIDSHANINPVTIDRIRPLQNKALVQYAVNRKIPYSIARRYTQEVYYHIEEKKFFSIAFKNDSGDYELRNQYNGSKICSGIKDITTFTVQDSDRLNLFEGFFDFLSFQAYYKLLKLPVDCVVLNSTSMLNKVIPLLEHYERINLFLDNDLTGIEAAEKVLAIHPNVIDYSKILYPNQNDVNDFLIFDSNKN
jgi:DNA primase